MKIAILSKADRFGGGASRVAEQLASLLLLEGHQVHHFVRQCSEPQTFTRSLHGSFQLGKIADLTNKVTRRLGFPDVIPWEFLPLFAQSIQSYDLLHFHDISSAISPLTLQVLAKLVPTIWTFHDCSPFTAGCLYPMGCRNFQSRCYQCPQLREWPFYTAFDFTGLLQDLKRQTAQRGDFVAIAPSQWMAKTALSSGMFPVSLRVIPNGIDCQVFKPYDKLALRRQLNLPATQPIVLLASSHLGEKRKGVYYALEALKGILDLNPYVLIVGQTSPDSQTLMQKFRTLETGYIDNDHQKAQYFAAADLLLFCSLCDNLPLVILEAMATGTPVVGFNTGGIPEIVIHQECGYLVPPTDVNGLITGLRLGLVEDYARVWSEQARNRIEKKFSSQLFLKNHLSLYKEAISRFKSKRLKL